MKARLDTASAIRTGQDLAVRNDGAAESFLSVFRIAYASDILDMPLIQALEKARSLSVDLASIPAWLAQDFRELALTCVQTLNLPKPKCAGFVIGLVRSVSRLVDHEGTIRSRECLWPFTKGATF